MRLFDWLRAIPRRVRASRHPRQKPRGGPRSLAAELLESRVLPSSISFTGDLQTPGVLVIELAEPSASTLTIGHRSVNSSSGVSFEAVRVTINGSLVSVQQASTRATLFNLPAALVGRVVVVGDEQANIIDLTGVTSLFGLQQAAAVGDQWPFAANLDEAKSLSVPSYFGAIVSTFGGDDRVAGGTFHEWIDLGPGDDGVTVVAGDNVVFGGSGDDSVLGGVGADCLDGGDGDDLLIGGLGNDTLIGDAGADVLVGGFGRDSLDGGSGNDLLVGATLEFDVSLINGANNVRDLWLASAANGEVRRQRIAPSRFVVLGVDDNGDGRVDPLSANSLRAKPITATSTRFVVPTSLAAAFDPANYVGEMPPGANFLARIDDEVVRIVSRVATDDPDTEILIVDRTLGPRATHEENSVLTMQAGSPSPLRTTALWATPVNADVRQTVFEDFVSNTLTGGSGEDWFFVSDELLSFSDTAGDPQLGGDDVLTDLSSNDDRYKAVQLVPDGRRQSVPPDLNVTSPTFGESFAAIRGTITRLGGDPGTEVLTASRLGGVADEPHLWGGLVRSPYVTTPSFNVSSDLVHLVNFVSPLGGPNEAGQTNWNLLLDVNQIADPSSGITPVTATIPSRNWRWSLNPAESHVEYGFVSGVGLDGESSGVRKYRYLTAADVVDHPSGIQQVYQHADQTLVFTSFDPWQVDGLIFTSKTSLFFNAENGHNYTVLLGNPRSASNPNEFVRSVLNAYVVDLDAALLPNTPENVDRWVDPVVASFTLTAPAGTAGFPYGSAPENVDDFYVAPDGSAIMVSYLSDKGAAFRLLDVDLANGLITPHVMPVTPRPAEDIPVLRRDDVRLNGFFPMRWHHPVFAEGASGQVYVVGQPGKWSKDTLVSPNIEYLAGSNVIGQVVRFDPETNKFASLTNPVFENILPGRETLGHITATNIQNPGYVFASYYSRTNPFTASSPAYQGAIVAINLEQPNGSYGAVVLARHRSQSGDNYIAQPIVNASSDGTQVLFHSTWGEYQQVISTYDIQPGQRVGLHASGSAVLRRTGANSVALFASTEATTPLAGTQTTVSAFDTLVVSADTGQSLQLSLDFSAGTPVPKGGVLEFDGTQSSADQLTLLNGTNFGEWDWFVTGEGTGQVRGASTGLIRFKQIESLAGSEVSDVFHISPTASWTGSLSGGTGIDRLNFGAFTSNVSVSLRDGLATFSGAVGQIAQFENVSGGDGNDMLVGDELVNLLNGGSGDDSLHGLGANDVLLGDLGDDVLRGGVGNDSINGGAGRDALSFADTSLAQAIVLTGTGSTDGFAGNAGATVASFTNIESLFGGSGSDSVRGLNSLATWTSSGATVNYSSSRTINLSDIEVLIGGTAADTFTLSGSTITTADGGSGSDTLVGSSLAGNVFTVSGANSGTIGSIAFANVENLRGANGPDSFVFSGGSPSLSGTLDGGTGTDTLSFAGTLLAQAIVLTALGTSDGFKGTSTSMTRSGFNNINILVGSTSTAASDSVKGLNLAATWTSSALSVTYKDNKSSRTINIASDVETLLGGTAVDTVTLSGATPIKTVDGGSGNDVINASAVTGNITLIGNAGNDLLTGGSQGDSIDGGAGLDKLFGSGGNDIIAGGDGKDSIDGGAGDDSLDGGIGNDTINGGSSGKDTIRGGAGNDKLDGGAGGTTVGAAPSSALADSDDIIHGGDGNDSILGQGGNDFLFGESGNDTIDGGDGHDVIDTGSISANNTSFDTAFHRNKVLGGNGNDAIRGSAGKDTLNGGEGDDCILGGAGVDSLLGGNGNDVLRG